MGPGRPASMWHPVPVNRQDLLAATRWTIVTYLYYVVGTYLHIARNVMCRLGQGLRLSSLSKWNEMYLKWSRVRNGPVFLISFQIV